MINDEGSVVDKYKIAQTAKNYERVTNAYNNEHVEKQLYEPGQSQYKPIEWETRHNYFVIVYH